MTSTKSGEGGLRSDDITVCRQRQRSENRHNLDSRGHLWMAPIYKDKQELLLTTFDPC